MEATATLSETVGVQAACSALNLPRATYYRHQRAEPGRERERPRPPLALAPEERQAVLEVLHAPAFVDRSPYQIWAVQLDEAQQAIKSAEALWYDDKDATEATHQAYLVTRRVAIARTLCGGLGRAKNALRARAPAVREVAARVRVRAPAHALDRHERKSDPELADVLSADRWGRLEVERCLTRS